MDLSENIIALSTPAGKGAIGLVRLSGESVIEEVDRFFKGKKLSLQKTHTLHFGKLIDEHKNLIDEVVIGIFKAPQSYTGEDVVEISCHGSPYIIQKIIAVFLDTNRVSYAQPGAFTQRAFLNGKLDLVQAEAVADLIESDNAFQHQKCFETTARWFFPKTLPSYAKNSFILLLYWSWNWTFQKKMWNLQTVKKLKL